MTKEKRKFNHGTKEARQRSAQERLGSVDAKCLLGPARNPHSLELHHVAGREFGDDVVPVCHNHHARLSDAFKDHPTKIPGGTNPLEECGHLLLGFAECTLIALEDLGDYPRKDLLIYLEGKLRAFGLHLIEIARSSSKRCAP